MRNRVLAGVRSGVATSVALLLLLGGCGDRGTSADPDPITSPSVISGSPTAGEPEPAVAAATGPVLTTGGVSMNAPKGFELMDELASILQTAQDPIGYSQISLAVTPDTGIDDLDALARIDKIAGNFDKGAKQLPNVTIAGVESVLATYTWP